MIKQKYTHTHTQTHSFNGPFSVTTWVDFTEARDSEWQWHQLGHMQVCISLQTDNDASTSPVSFLQAGCPSCHPTNSVKALKAKALKAKIHLTPIPQHGNYCQQHCRKKEKQSWTTYSLFALLCCMWNYDRSLKVWRQNTASIAECKYSWTVLQWSLCRKEAFIDSVKVHYVTVQLSTPLMDEQTSYNYPFIATCIKITEILALPWKSHFIS